MISTDPMYNEVYIIISHGQYNFESSMSNHSFSDLEWLKYNLYNLCTFKNQFNKRIVIQMINKDSIPYHVAK